MKFQLTFQNLHVNVLFQGIRILQRKKMSKSLRKAWFSERALKTLKDSLPVEPMRFPFNTSQTEQQMSEKAGQDAA